MNMLPPLVQYVRNRGQFVRDKQKSEHQDRMPHCPSVDVRSSYSGSSYDRGCNITAFECFELLCERNVWFFMEQGVGLGETEFASDKAFIKVKRRDRRFLLSKHVPFPPTKDVARHIRREH
eukprot:TRINITY_DN30622_c0_g1_i1.p1 TRINITY_DN30622_c0_g1~~TRINITY_DN30622_c0_g1_i1.p1  ORF type:complete len:121 (+),score=1.68 TRINITY_DN30622_c0_g1_i1:264-626(+)